MDTLPSSTIESIERESLQEAYSYARNKLARGESYANPVPSSYEVRAELHRLSTKNPSADSVQSELFERGMWYTKSQVIELCARHGYALADV